MTRQTIPPEWAELARKAAAYDNILEAIDRLTFEAERRAGVPKAEIARARAAITKAKGGVV